MKKVRLFAPLIVSTLSIPTVCLVGCNETPTVGVPVEGVQIAKTNAGCSINDKLTLEYTIEPANATDKSVTWISSDNEVATIDENGVITARQEGSVTITVKTNDGGFESSCELNVWTPLCFEKSILNNNDTSISYEIKGTLKNIDIEYSNDCITWNDWSAGETQPIKDGQKLYVRNTKSTLSSKSNHFKFLINDENNTVKASGNVDSMINYSALTSYCYYGMFENCNGLTLPPQLPSTQLADHCYNDMFGYCSSLTKAPALPATTLATGCYYAMFLKCTSLFVVPTLPLANHFAQSCYGHMFIECSQLHISQDESGGVGALLLDLTEVKSLPKGATVWMFDRTAGPFTDDPQPEHKYYWFIE